MDFLDDRNPFSDAGTSPADASPNQGNGMTTLMLTEFDSRNTSSNLRTCGRCGQEKRLADFPISFRKAKECKFCVVLKKRGHLCMPSDISDEFSSTPAAPQEQQQQQQQEQLMRQGEPSSPDRSRNHTRRGSLNITPVLTKSLRNLLSKGDAAAMVPPLAVSNMPDAQYV